MFEKKINAFFIFYQFSGSFANCPKTNVMPQRRRVHKTDQTHLELVPGKQTLKKDITKNDRHVRVLRNPRMRNLVSRPEVPPGDLFWCYYQEKTKGTSLSVFPDQYSEDSLRNILLMVLAAPHPSLMYCCLCTYVTSFVNMYINVYQGLYGEEMRRRHQESDF